MTDGGAFADLLTRQMTDVGHDRQLMVSTTGSKRRLATGTNT